MDSGLGWILSRFFVEKAFSEKAKDFGDQIVSDIKEMFIEKLKSTTWMDESVVELAIEKVHKIVQKIGYPTKVRTSILSFYQKLTKVEPFNHGSSKPLGLLSLLEYYTIHILRKCPRCESL